MLSLRCILRVFLWCSSTMVMVYSCSSIEQHWLLNVIFFTYWSYPYDHSICMVRRLRWIATGWTLVSSSLVEEASGWVHLIPLNQKGEANPLRPHHDPSFPVRDWASTSLPSSGYTILDRHLQTLWVWYFTINKQILPTSVLSRTLLE